MRDDARRVDCGLFIPQVGFDFPGLVERAHACEESGFHSIWLADHLWARGLPEVDHLEIWTTLAALAMRTSRLRLGSLVLCNSYRNPALVAKMAASLDQVSGGRLELGMGAGWMDEEYRGYGYHFPPVRVRIEQLDEGVEVIRRLLTETRATFQGKYYALDDAPNNPKSVQKPYPPITIGGSGERLMLRVVAKHADRWNCPMNAAADIGHKLAVLRSHCADVGRDPAAITVSEQVLVVLGKDEADFKQRWAMAKRFLGTFADLDRVAVRGVPDQVAAGLRSKIDGGVRVFTLMFGDLAPVETIRLFGERVLPALV
ncbi:MAG: TIGR03560 family F420-dependent LLM class oxidoreductase [Candidatus Binatia bacterium]